LATVRVEGVEFPRDAWTNVTPRILGSVGRRLHLQPQHPLGLIKRRIVDYFNQKYQTPEGSPMFSVHERLSPVVTTHQNFDSLLVPPDHVSRSKSDSYYLDQATMLRAHTSAHQADLLAAGHAAFLVVGDVYRRDEIDSSHYPVFHQMEGVRLLAGEELGVPVRGEGERSEERQAGHPEEATRRVEADLKDCLEGLAVSMFGEVERRWVGCYFPFTHPSWELEVLHEGQWLEVLGCGVMEQRILATAGVEDRLGWAFGLGLERLAMVLYKIPDIRVFWSVDSGVLAQFAALAPGEALEYRGVSRFPQCTNDLSFWLPAAAEGQEKLSPNDFYDLVREVGGDQVEQVRLVDEFWHPKKKLDSQTYRIVYRNMEKTLTQVEANSIHSRIERLAVSTLGVTVR